MNLESTFSFNFDSFEPVNNLYLHYWLDWNWTQLVASFLTRLKLKTTCTFIFDSFQVENNLYLHFGHFNLESTFILNFDSFEPVNNLNLLYWLDWSWKQLVALFLTRLKLKTTCTFILVVWIWNHILVSFLTCLSL